MNREIEARLKMTAIDRTGNILSKIGKQLSDVNRRAVALNKQQGLLAKSTTAMYATLMRYAGPAVLAYGVKQAVVEYADLERQMGRIGITAGATKDETVDAFAAVQREAKGMALPLDQAMKALDTLVSSGMSLKQAMEFLPSVLATAQASGADTADIANTAIKTTSALKLEAKEMQRAFDIMVEGGKAGQFELKDMAAYIPDLANSFASLGYSGEDGLKKLIAMLQTVREDTGTSEAAATNLQNVFGKIYSEDTANKFKKMGIDLNAELAKARKNGEDTVSAFVRISNEAIKGDLTKLPRLFTDQQFRLGMQSLMTSAESYQKFLKAVNDSKVDGSVFRDLERVTGDTQASIDRLSASWDKLMLSVGSGASRILVPAMDAVSKDLDYGEALRRGLEKQGMTNYWDREWWIAKNLPLGGLSKSKEADIAALAGGYKDETLRKQYMQGPELPYGWQKPEQQVRGAIPIPREKPTREKTLMQAYARGGNLGREFIRPAIEKMRNTDYGKAQQLDDFYGSPGDEAAIRAHMDRKKAWRERRAVFAAADERASVQAGRDGDARLTGMTQGVQADAKQAADTLKQGADAGGKTIEQSGESFAQSVMRAAERMTQAATQLAATLANAKISVSTVGVTPTKVNANTGKTNTFVNSPATLGHQ